MAIQKILIDQFLLMAKAHPVLDVRSPGEYIHAHIPGAYSLPLFTDEERIVVGTAYKQQSREVAIKIGLDYFGVKMRGMVETVEQLFLSTRDQSNTAPSQKNTVLVHCWRGGMRSAGVAWLLDLYGFSVFTLAGGYKAYRQWARTMFDQQYPFCVVGGYTGSGKTLVLQQLKREGKKIVDLEGIANHKGSAFGALGENAQPSQEMFENLLAVELAATIDINTTATANSRDSNSPIDKIYIEDESQRIGLLNIPGGLWQNMRKSQVVFIDVPLEERLNYLTSVYGKFSKEQLVNAIIRIQKRLGGLETKLAINHLLEDNYKECFRVLLKYYDKWYSKALVNRDNLPVILNKIACDSVDVTTITYLLINEKSIVV